MAKNSLDIIDTKLLEMSKELTIAWIQKYGNNETFHPDAEQVTQTFQTIYKSLKEII